MTASHPISATPERLRGVSNAPASRRPRVPTGTPAALSSGRPIWGTIRGLAVGAVCSHLEPVTTTATRRDAGGGRRGGERGVVLGGRAATAEFARATASAMAASMRRPRRILNRARCISMAISSSVSSRPSEESTRRDDRVPGAVRVDRQSRRDRRARLPAAANGGGIGRRHAARHGVRRPWR